MFFISLSAMTLPQGSEVRVFLLTVVCNAGLYKKAGKCHRCQNNRIKPRIGDARRCNSDPPCDGIVTVPNQDHTACGMYFAIELCINKIEANYIAN